MEWVSELVHDDGAETEWNFCIPSVLSVHKSGRVTWLTGDHVFAQLPGTGIDSM